MRDSTKKKIVGWLLAGACALGIINGAVTLKDTVDEHRAEQELEQENND